MRQFLFNLLLPLLCLRVSPAMLQIEIPEDLVTGSCQGRIHASLFLEGQSSPLPSTAVAGPDGFPRKFHLLFAYDQQVESRPVERVELQVGEAAQTWAPPRGSLYYMKGPAFPVAGAFQPASPCPQAAVPAQTGILSILPYPCHGTSTVHFALENPGPVRLRVYNLVGDVVERLVEQDLVAGSQWATFHGQALESGLYLLVLDACGKRLTSRLLLLKEAPAAGRTRSK